MKEQNTEKDDYTSEQIELPEQVSKHAEEPKVPEMTPEQKAKSDKFTKMIKRQLFKRREINNRHAFRKFY